jgi:PAS domain S-box-containing protein
MDALSSARRWVAVSDLPPRALLQAVVEMSDDAIFTCDVAARVTPSAGAMTAERLFGARADEVRGAHLSSALFSPHLRHEVRDG